MELFFQACHTLDVSYACNSDELWEKAMHTLAQDEDVYAVVVESPALTRARFKRLVTVLRGRKRRIGALTCSGLCPDVRLFLFEYVAKLHIPRLCLRQNAASVPCVLQNTSHLTHLDLSQNAIGPGTLPMLVHGLRMHKKLQCLSLSQNPLGDAGLMHLVPLLAVPMKLRRLYLADTKAASLGAAKLAEYICEHPSLEVLDLSENRSLGTIGWCTLSLALERNQSLRVLNLAFTSPELKNVHQMAKSLEENHTLQVLEYTFYGAYTEEVCEAEEVISKYLTRNQRVGAH